MTTTAPVDAAPAPAAAPAGSPAPTSAPEAEPAESAAVAGDSLALHHPGQPRTRSTGEIKGPEAPAVPAAGKFASPCADRKPGESWESDGSTCRCDPAGQVRCARQTELGKELRGMTP